MSLARLKGALLLPALIVFGAVGPAHATAHTPRAAIGVVRGELGAPVVDSVHHLIFGRSTAAISELDEATGRMRTLTRLAPQHGPVMLAVDPAARRLLVEDLRTDRTARSGNVVFVTALADDIDTRTGKIISTVTISSFPLYVYTYQQGSVAIDQSLHHGFVTDHAGQGVMIDLTRGRLLRRFHPGIAASEDGSVENTSAVVDERSHRLFIAVAAAHLGRGADEMTVINTTTGRIVRRLGLGLDFLANLVIDASHRRVLASDLSRVAIIDSVTGRFLRRVNIGTFADLLAAAPHEHRAFLLVTPLADTGAHAGHRYLEWIDDLSGRVHVSSRLGPAAGNTYVATTGAVDASLGRLFVLPETEPTLSVFSTGTGRLLARVPILHQLDPLQFLYGMAVDPGTHRLVIGGLRGALLVDTQPPYTY